MQTVVRYCAVTALLLAVLFAGCEKSDPVRLVDPVLDGTLLQVEATPPQNEAFSPAAQDSPGFFVPSLTSLSGKLIIAGSLYDGPVGHHEASLAKAEFFDRSQPEIDNDDTVGYHSFDLGYVTVDDLPLDRRLITYTNSLQQTDTLGATYALLNRDGFGGRGFSYSGRHTYLWRLTGSDSVGAISLSILAPPGIHVTAPTPADTISVYQNLRMAWSGGGAVVHILISSPGLLPRNLLQLRLAANTGSVVLPSRILRLLPPAQSRFLFTVISENDTTFRTDRYADNITARVITSHSLLLHLTR